MRGAKPWVVSLPLLLLIAALMPGAGGEESDEEPVKWVESYEGRGMISYAAAWRIEAPVLGCQALPVPGVYTVKTCGGIRGAGSPGGEFGYDVDESVQTIVVGLAWSPNGPFGEYLQLDTFCPEVGRGPSGAVLNTDHPCYLKVEGEYPLSIRVDDTHWQEHGYDPLGEWTARVFASSTMVDSDYAGVGVVYEQEFTLTVTLYHNFHAP